MIIQTTKQLAPRADHDFYPTPRAFADATVSTVADWVSTTAPFVLDPGAGGGVFGEAVRAYFPDAHITGVDVRPLSRPRAYDYWLTGGYDFTLPRVIEPVFDLVIGNPPYVFAETFVRHAMNLLAPRGNVVMLLRLAFLEGQGRARGLWREYPPYKVWVLSQRPSFTGNGKTDATAYAVFHWMRGHRGETSLGWLDIGKAAASKPRQLPLFEDAS